MKTVFDIGDHIIFLYKGQKWWEGNREDLKHAQTQIKELDQFIKASYFE
jgi:phospholipid/cholesterol/gamma-HCH transport system ATP-binding protein